MTNQQELERAIKGFWFWIRHKGKHFQDPITGTGKHSGNTVDVWLEKSLIDWAKDTSTENDYLKDLLIQNSEEKP